MGMGVYMPGEAFLPDVWGACRSGLTLSAHALSLGEQGKASLTDHRFSAVLAKDPSH